MATSSAQASFDFEAWAEQISSQFRDLNMNEPGQWPLLPKLVAGLFAAVVVPVLAAQRKGSRKADQEPKLISRACASLRMSAMRKHSFSGKSRVSADSPPKTSFHGFCTPRRASVA